MTPAAPDLPLLAELRRLLPDPERVELTVAAADPLDVVLHVHPSMQHIFVERQRHRDGVLARRPVGDVIELLHAVGAEATAAKLAAPPPADHTWVAWLARGRALATPWPAPSLDVIVGATLTVARPDLASLAEQARAKGVAFRELAFVVGRPDRVEQVTGRRRCGCLVAGDAVGREHLAGAVLTIAGRAPWRADLVAGIARDLRADVPPGHVRVLVLTTDCVGTVTTIPVPRRGEPWPRYACDGGQS